MALDRSFELAGGMANGQQLTVDVPRLFQGVTVVQGGLLIVRDLRCTTCWTAQPPFIHTASVGPGGEVLLDSLELRDLPCKGLSASPAIQALRHMVHAHATGRAAFKTVDARMLRLLGSVRVPGPATNSTLHLRNITLSCGRSAPGAQASRWSPTFWMVALWSMVAAAIYVYVSHLSRRPLTTPGSKQQLKLAPTPRLLDDAAVALMAQHGITACGVIGQGSFGRVYKAWYNGQCVAAKMVEFAVEDDNNTKHILLECNLATAFCHPSVVWTLTCMVDVLSASEYLDAQQRKLASRLELATSAYDVGAGYELATGMQRQSLPASQQQWQAQARQLKAFRVILVMENCDAGTLWAALQQGWFHTSAGQPNMDAILRTALEVAQALTYLHSLRVIHTDVTSRNILLKRCSHPQDPRGFTAKVADFGLSMLLDANQTHSSTAQRGTLAYMPPEMLLGTNLTFATDIYSFGIILWELITQDCPYAGLSEPQIVSCKVQGFVDLQPPRSCPAGYAALMRACLHRDPLQRPSIELVDAWLQRLLEGLHTDDHAEL